LFTSEHEADEAIRILAELHIREMTVKTGEIFPANNAPVLSLTDGKPTLDVMKWGFPKWDGKGVITNSRSETVAEKKMFAKALIERRCVIPSTGFFEWSRDDKGKARDKYLFNVAGTQMLYMAAVYSVSEDGRQFVIITREANGSVSDIHQNCGKFNRLTTRL